MPQNLSDAGVSWKVYRNKTLGPISSVLTTACLTSFKQSADPRSDSCPLWRGTKLSASFAADVLANRSSRGSPG